MKKGGALKKVLLAIVLFIAAGFVAFVIKDAIDYNMDQKYPGNAVPQMTVAADSVEAPLPNVIAGYVWHLHFGKQVSRLAIPVYEIEGYEEVHLMGGEMLELTFSRNPTDVRISRSDAYSYNFNPVDGALTVPYEEGKYIYEVYAKFEKGSVMYYFYVVVDA